MKKLNEVFDVAYGNKLDTNKMTPRRRREGGISFVTRASKNNGVSGTVAPLPDLEPFPAGSITVALGGSKLLSSHVQLHPFYTGQNVAVLQPKQAMTFGEKVYTCICIRHNRFRYSAFGREANRTLREMPIPDPKDFPGWTAQVADDPAAELAVPAVEKRRPPGISPNKWQPFRLADLFDIKKGKRLTKANMTPGNTPFVSAVSVNNGVVAHIGQDPLHPANVLTVPYDGSIGEAFYQEDPFWAADSVNVLYPRFEMTPQLGIFLATVIRREKYRFNYGRKWNLGRMKDSTIRLPATLKGTPDWKAMTLIVDTLPYSSQLQ